MDRPVGLYDSGFGGLTVMKEVIRLLPQENIVYLGDTAHLPYGTKSPQTILRFAMDSARFLAEKNCKLIIIACHTACSHALLAVQNYLSIPVIGVVQPGFEALVDTTQSGHVAVLGTTSTIRSGIYQSLVERHHPAIQIYPIACPLFVPLIEEGFCNTPAAELIAQSYLGTLPSEQIDAVLLGCTHYPLMRPILQKIVGPEITLIEPAAQCANSAKAILESQGLLNNQKGKPRHEFFVTDDPEKFKFFGKMFLGSQIDMVEKRG